MDHRQLNRLLDLTQQLREARLTPAHRDELASLIEASVDELTATESLPAAVEDLRRLLDTLTPAEELKRLRLIEQLLGVAHWGVDALWSTTLKPEDFPDTLDGLWAYIHAVVDHEEFPTAERIQQLRQQVEDAYRYQRPGLALEDRDDY